MFTLCFHYLACCTILMLTVDIMPMLPCCHTDDQCHSGLNMFTLLAFSISINPMFTLFFII